MRNLIHSGLDSATSEDEQTLYIQFIRNSEQPEFIPKLLKFAEHSDYPLVHHLAITTLGVFNPKNLGSEVLNVMNRIFHQNKRKYETTVRSAAANLMLMSNPTQRDVQNMFLSLPALKSRELANFLLARVFDLINTNHASK